MLKPATTKELKLDDIGFYTLSEERAKNLSNKSPIYRTEIIITPRCNFSCSYCRGPRSDWNKELSFEEVKRVVDIWTKDGLKNIRFSGGEPTVHPHLLDIIKYTKSKNVERIAISTNGSAKTEFYQELVDAGVNDFSISLDACCTSFGDQMAGVKGQFNCIVENIRYLSEITYVTVGVVLTEENVSELNKIVEFAHKLGVADIRIISAAQYNAILEGVKDIRDEILDCHPILKYRVENIRNGLNVRGIKKGDCHKCYLIKDDDVVAGNKSFPCVIYMREHGDPICEVSENMREKRIKWFEKHNSYEDKICRENCLDVCRNLNLRVEEYIFARKNNLP
jgi:molybdenum cofactor biosynthesis enzyme MoaA